MTIMVADLEGILGRGRRTHCVRGQEGTKPLARKDRTAMSFDVYVTFSMTSMLRRNRKSKNPTEENDW